MSQNRRFSRIGLAVAAGLIALVGFTPTGAVAGSSNSDGSQVVKLLHGDNWCC